MWLGKKFIMHLVKKNSGTSVRGNSHEIALDSLVSYFLCRKLFPTLQKAGELERVCPTVYSFHVEV